MPPTAMTMTPFMVSLSNQLIEERKIAETTALQYMRTLYSLNDKKNFTSLAWLKDIPTIQSRLATFAPSTQRGYVAAIVVALTPMKTKAGYKKVYQHYYDAMNVKKPEGTPDKIEGGKTEKQTENWVSWEAVQAKLVELSGRVDLFKAHKTITPVEYHTLLQFVILSLYTMIQPRRNQDYLDMSIVKKWTDALPKTHNYLDNVKAPTMFRFNKYKTAKKYGEQTVPIPAPLGDVLLTYFKHHPGVNSKMTEVPFLVTQDGAPFNSANAITRILNRIFGGKKVGSSMLRHIYITDKYGAVKDEMEEDALAMGHSVSEQQGVYNVAH